MRLRCTHDHFYVNLRRCDGEKNGVRKLPLIGFFFLVSNITLLFISDYLWTDVLSLCLEKINIDIHVLYIDLKNLSAFAVVHGISPVQSYFVLSERKKTTTV